MYVAHNGHIKPAEEVRILPLDRGLLLGDGLFETILAVSGRPFLLERHYRRLKDSAAIINIDLPYELPKISSDIEKLILMEGLSDKEAYVRLTLTRGAESGKLLLEKTAEPTFLIMVKEYLRYPDSFYEQGVEVVSSNSIIRSSSSPVHRIKSTSYIENIMLRQGAADRNAFEAVVFNEKGELCEGSFTNVFCVIDGEVVTPDDGCNLLGGITRDYVMEICARENIPVRKGILTREDIAAAAEIFLTNSLIGIMPVRRLDGAGVGEECPGKDTQTLMRIYDGELRGSK